MHTFAFLSANEDGLLPLHPLGEVSSFRDASSGGNMPRKKLLSLMNPVPADIGLDQPMAIVLMKPNGHIERTEFGQVTKPDPSVIELWLKPGQENLLQVTDLRPSSH
jgi:hypothetical protein